MQVSRSLGLLQLDHLLAAACTIQKSRSVINIINTITTIAVTTITITTTTIKLMTETMLQVTICRRSTTQRQGFDRPGAEG